MNILLGALVLALLLLPGLLFRLAYLSPTFSSRPFKASFIDELLFSLVPAFLIQTAAYLVVDGAVCNVREKVFVLLLLNSDKVATQLLSFGDVWRFGAYLTVVCLLAMSLGMWMRRISLRRQWHQKYSFLRIYTEWEIYFEGFILDDPRQAGRGRKADILERWLDVSVEAKDGTLLYCGYLDKYVLTKDEKLDRIYLSGVRRRRLTDDAKSAVEQPVLPEGAAEEVEYHVEEMTGDSVSAEGVTDFDERYYFMPGHYFMIPGTEIRNINITYLLKDEIAEEEAA